VEKANLDQIAYARAKEYLLSFARFGITNKLLDEYLNPTIESLRPSSIRGIYQRILESAQNRGMSSGVIMGPLGGNINALRKVLCNFEAALIASKYGNNSSKVIEDIERELHLKGKIQRTQRSIWPLFCRSITSGALFLSQFDSADDFYRWVNIFDRDDRIRPALPMLLSHEIEGFGFPLACDFLKEIGYFNFCKPDVHIKAIFKGIRLVSEVADDYQVFKAITRVSKSQGVTPYNVDKLFWLVGSGKFYNHTHIGSFGKIPTDREEFIRKFSQNADK